MKKISTAAIAEQLSQMAGMNKKTTESFIRAFVETVLTGVSQDGVVKIKDFGTFKAVNVAQRESVNVVSGERFTIAGFNKLSFTPDVTLLAMLNSVSAETTDTAPPTTDEEPEEETPTAELDPIPTPTPEETVVPEAEAAPVAAVIEEPVVVSDEPAAEVAAEPVAVSDEPAAEVAAEPVAVSDEPVVEVAAEPVAVSDEPVAEDETEPVAVSDEPAEIAADTTPTAMAPANVKSGSDVKKWTSLILAIIVVVAVVAFAWPKQTDNEPQAQLDKLTEIAQTQPQPAIDQADEPKRKVHILQKGESLTTISVYYYNTKDSMQAIWKLNGFKDPNNIPLGTEILLP